MSEIVWRGMTRAELDKAYDNTNAVADSGTRRDFGDARTIEVHHFKAETTEDEQFTHCRNAAELGHEHAGEGSIFLIAFVRQFIERKQFTQVLHWQGAIDQP